VRLAIVLLRDLSVPAICGTMTVGLFRYIDRTGIARVPSTAWEWLGMPAAALQIRGPRRPARADTLPSLLAVAGSIAAACRSCTTTRRGGRGRCPPIEAAIDGLCLHRAWGMFGPVHGSISEVYTRATLADGRMVDVLRGGRPVEDVRPTDGFLSLPHHRWHKLFSDLPQPRSDLQHRSRQALARHWNAGHDAAERIISLDIRFARMGTTAADDTSTNC